MDQTYFTTTKHTSYDVCSNLTLKQLESVALTRGITGAVCFVLCFATFIFELVYMCRLKKTTTLQRLFLYLTFSTLLYVGVLSLHIEHFWRYDSHIQGIVCKTIGFLDQYTGSVQLMFTVGITIALFNSLFRIVCTPFNRLARAVKPSNKQQKLRCGYTMETVLVIVCFVVPAFFAWIPFIRAPYGETGPWCWIVSEDKSCFKRSDAYLEQILLWYVPFILVTSFSFLCVFVLLLFFIYVRCWLRFLPQQAIDKVKEMCLLFSFLLMLCIVCIVETVTRNAVDKKKYDAFGLWMAYAIITPIGGIVIPISFFVYFLYNKCTSKKEPQEMDNQPRRESDHADVADGFFHPPNRVSAASNTDERSQNFWTCSGDTFASLSGSSYVNVKQPLLDSGRNSSSSRGYYETT